MGKRSVGILHTQPITVIIDPEKELFPGLVVLVLACAALLRKKGTPDESNWRLRVYAFVALAAVACSLGPTVRVWGHVVTRHGPYSWLLKVVPGMDGMRVPSRFAMIVSAALAVMAAFGVQALLVRLRPSMRPWVAGAIAFAILGEGWVVPLTTFPYNSIGRVEDRAVADWLRTRPAVAVLHLPTRGNDFQEMSYQYATLFHGHPIVNGYSGYDSPLQALLRNPNGRCTTSSAGTPSSACCDRLACATSS